MAYDTDSTDSLTLCYYGTDGLQGDHVIRNVHNCIAFVSTSLLKQ